MSALELVNVSKRLRGRNVLTDVSLHLHAGMVAGLLGLNGAGKTTTIRICVGLLRPTTGSVYVLGEPLSASSAPSIVGGLVSRAAIPTHLTASEALAAYVRLVSPADTAVARSVDGLLSEFGASDFADKRVGSLSTGMRQRVGLAIAFAGSPKIVLLDEPSDGLDPEGVVMVREAVRKRAAQGIAILLSSHLLTEVEGLADSVYIIHRGRIVAQGGIDELRGKSTLVVSFAEAEAALRAAPLLVKLGISAELESVGARRVHVESDNGAVVMRQLAGAGLFPTELKYEAVSLEQVFLAVTRDSP